MNFEKKKVLIIDDQEEIRDLVDITLRDTEFEVIKASSGKEGIQVAKELKPDIILLDIMMPEIDGFMTCNMLKRNSDTQDIPVIFLTAKQTTMGRTIALKAGAQDYIMKPFSPNDLLSRLKRLLPDL
jgi:DNA-binding response OmpR family regulator